MSDITERLRAAVPTYEGTPIAWPCEVRSDLLLEAAAEVERLREALENIVGHWNHAHDEALKRWEGSRTQAFEDLEYVEAADIKPLVDIARAALEAKP